MAAKKKATKRPRKAARPRRVESPPFSEVEDFYLVGKAGEQGAAATAAALGRPLAEVEARMRELGVDPTAAASRAAQARRDEALKGFGTKVNERTGEVSVVVMTESRSLLDDRRSGISPPELGGQGRRAPRKNPLDQFRTK